MVHTSYLELEAIDIVSLRKITPNRKIRGEVKCRGAQAVLSLLDDLLEGKQVKYKLLLESGERHRFFFFFAFFFNLKQREG